MAVKTERVCFMEWHLYPCEPQHIQAMEHKVMHFKLHIVTCWSQMKNVLKIRTFAVLEIFFF